MSATTHSSEAFSSASSSASTRRRRTATTRDQSFAVVAASHALPIERFPSPEHLYSATGLAPATYESATLRRRGRISRAGLAEFRDALMGIAWGLSQNSPTFASRDRALRDHVPSVFRQTVSRGGKR